MRMGMTGCGRGRHLRRRAAAFFLLLLIIGGIYTLFVRIQPAFETAMEYYANRLVTDTVSRAAGEALSEAEGTFSNSQNNGSFTVVEADTVKINSLRFKIDEMLNERLENGAGELVKIPLGSISGFYVLNGWGPKIPVKVMPVSMISSDFEEGFESAGINAVKHKLYLNVHVTVRYSGFLLSREKSINTSVPIIETIISGEVPHYYGGTSIAGIDKPAE